MAVGRVRKAVLGLVPYRPGKAAAQVEHEHGISDAIKLASNENPYNTAPSVSAAIADAATTLNRYGDHRASEMRSAIASWLDVGPDQVAVGCGSVGLLQQICLTYVDPGDEVVYPWLSFEAYPIMVKMLGGTPVEIALVDHEFDMDAIADAVTDRTKLVLLATPNNPTGTAVSVAQIETLLDRIGSDVVVLIDEAYREFSDPQLGDPVHDLLGKHRNVIVTRTFSKAYGLAGVRSGYAIADPEIISELDKVLLAFTVNSLAQAGALAALANMGEIQPRIDRLLAERDRVVKALSGQGWSLPDGKANFVYIPIADATNDIAVGLEREGVVVRPFPGNGIRVTIGTAAENDRFLETFAALWAERP